MELLVTTVRVPDAIDVKNKRKDGHNAYARTRHVFVIIQSTSLKINTNCMRRQPIIKRKRTTHAEA